jgi:mRNA export factor
VGSIEGRVGVHHLDDSQQSKNFTFKCHREGTNGSEIYAVNSLNFHPVSSLCLNYIQIYSNTGVLVIYLFLLFLTALLDTCKVHHTFATSGSDGAFNFWDKDSKQRLKVCYVT